MNTILSKASRRFLLAQPLQLGLAILGIALGVAVVTSVDIARVSAERAFDVSFEAVAGRATHQILGGPNGLDEALYVRLRTRAGIYPAAPIVEGRVTPVGKRGTTLHILGVDPYAESPFRDHLRVRGLRDRDRRANGELLRRLVTEPGTTVLSPATAHRLGVRPGQDLALQIGTRVGTLNAIGLVEPGEGRSGLDDLLITDIATAQALLGMAGRISHIDLALAEDAAGAVAERRIRALLPPGAELTPSGRRSEATKGMTRAFEANLVAMSLLALLVGAFLIYNTMNLAVVQRRELFGSLRALGVTGGQVYRMVILEAFAIGALASVLGLGIGALLGHGLVGLVARTINDLYFTVTVRELSFTPQPLLKGLALGLCTTLLAAQGAALEAARVPPRVSLSRADLEARFRRTLPRAGWLGGLCLVLSGTMFLASGKSLELGFAAEFALIGGAALLTPVLTLGGLQLLDPLIARWLGSHGRMAVRNVGAGLSRTAVATAALMVAIATTIGVGILIESFRIAVGDWLYGVLRADLYITTPGPDATAPPFEMDRAFRDRIVALPEVEAVSTVRRFRVEIAGQPTDIAVYEMAPGSYRGFRFKEGSAEDVWRAFEEQGAVLVSEPLAYHRDLHQGDSITLRTDRGPQALRIAGVYYDYSSDRGWVAMSRRTYERYWQGGGYSSIGVYARPGIDDARLRTAIEARLPEGLGVGITPSRTIRAESMKLFDRTFAFTRVLRLLAAVIAFAGVFSALMALALERTRELGLLRALGMTQAGLFGLLLVETGLTGLIAGLLSVPVGVGIAATLVYVLYERCFGWSMDLHVDPVIVAQGIALAVGAALLAGIYPARRAARGSPAAVLRND
ncbi:MAG: ABC transporter permease [Pseudomonadota bacterium]|nr:ABC transporter permease [Pseudomonadota bacterium]